MEFQIAVDRGGDSDAIERDELIHELMADLRALDMVWDVRPVRTYRLPAGAKGQAMALGAAQVEMAERSNFDQLVSAIGSFLRRDKERTIRIELNGNSFVATNLKPEDQQQMMAWFVANAQQQKREGILPAIGLPEPLITKLRVGILECAPTIEEEDLLALFVDERLVEWRHLFPDDADNAAERVSSLIALLYDKSNQFGSGIALLLQLIRSQLDSTEACFEQLAQLETEYLRATRLH